MKLPQIQNIQIKGTIKEYKKAYEDLYNLLERISTFAIKQYEKQHINKNVKTYHRISLNDKIFIILIIKQNAQHNPYFAIMDMNNLDNPIQYTTSVKTLLPLLDDNQEESFRKNIISSFSRELSLTKIDNQLIDYIDEYDAEYS